MLSNVLYVIRIVALGLWVGAMTGFAFLFAPIAFAHVGPTPQFAATIAGSVRAIAAFGGWLAVIAAAITVFAKLETMRVRIAIVISTALALACSTYEVRAIIPKMQATPLLTAAYEALHRQSSGVYSAVLVFALIALVLSSRSAYRSA